MDTLVDQSSSGLVLQVILLGERCETPVLADVDLLSAGKLELGSSEGLNSDGGLVVPGSDGHEHLTNIHSSGDHHGLTESTSHTGLESIGTSARKHFVNSDNVIRMGSDSQVEEILTRGLNHVLVASNTGSLQSLGSDLLVLVRNQVNGRWESVARRSLVTDVVNTQLGVGDTSAVPRLRVRLVLAVAIAASWSSTHSETTNSTTTGT